jgi:hypothetical protein
MAKDGEKRVLFKLGSGGKRLSKISFSPSMTIALKTGGVVCAFGLVVLFFAYLGRYVKKVVPVSEKMGILKLVDPPVWLNEPLKEKIFAASIADNEDLKLDEDAARSIQKNLQSRVAWIDNVRVQVTHDSIYINARWRRPLALIETDGHKFYVDVNLTVLDYLPMPNLPIVEVKGLAETRGIPQPGRVWQHDDLTAAVNILARLDRMDKLVAPNKPLLGKISSIDVGNFNGRRKDSEPHIFLNTTEDIEVIWGAELGTWQRYLEATDEEKLAKLYGFYKEHNFTLGDVKYINLRDPQDRIRQPTDKY